MKIALSLVLAFHSLLSGYAIYQKGYFGAFPPFEDLWTYQIFSDLVISVGLLWYFLYRDAKRRSRPSWKIWLCAVGIILAGSIAPLIYLLLEGPLRENSNEV